MLSGEAILLWLLNLSAFERDLSPSWQWVARWLDTWCHGL